MLERVVVEPNLHGIGYCTRYLEADPARHLAIRAGSQVSNREIRDHTKELTEQSRSEVSLGCAAGKGQTFSVAPCADFEDLLLQFCANASTRFCLRLRDEDIQNQVWCLCIGIRRDFAAKAAGMGRQLPKHGSAALGVVKKLGMASKAFDSQHSLLISGGY